jgi:large subunit ribosomal protein L25
MSITVNNLDFRHVYSKVKETGVVYVEVDSKSTPCLISGIQKHPVMESLLHVDFKKINLKQKTEAAVPVNFVGESEAVKNKNGVLITQLDHLTVECLPMDIPSQIDIDLESLKEIGDEIKLKDLKPLDKITYIDEPESVVVSVTAHKEEEIEPDTTAESPTIETDEKKEEGDKEESASEEKDRKE